MLAEEEVWDKKKLIIGIVIVLFLGLFIYFGILNTGEKPSPNIRGESVKVQDAASKINLRKDVNNKLEEIKQNADEINVAEIASSSPQIQKVINDIKNLQNLPSNQARDACLKICGNL